MPVGSAYSVSCRHSAVVLRETVVREASPRVRASAAACHGLLPGPSVAVRPAVWGGSKGALATQEAAWVAKIHSMGQLLVPASTNRSRSTSAFGPDWAAGAP